MKKQSDILIEKRFNIEECNMSENIEIKNVNGVDVCQYQPKGVCSKLMQFRVKDDIIQDIEFVGGCSGNLSGIGVLIRGMNINDVVSKLKGIPCGKRTTSCPDQLAQAIEAYIETKTAVKA